MSECPLCRKRLLGRHAGPLFLGEGDVCCKENKPPNDQQLVATKKSIIPALENTNNAGSSNHGPVVRPLLTMNSKPFALNNILAPNNVTANNQTIEENGKHFGKVLLYLNY